MFQTQMKMMEVKRFQQKGSQQLLSIVIDAETMTAFRAESCFQDCQYAPACS